MTHKLLLADDSITIQRVIELTFSGEDIEVVSVGDGALAIERLQSDRPDIVLADISMPKRNGYDVTTYVRSQPDFAHVPVLLLAGAFDPVDQARADEVGCDGVLVKPFEPQQVVARVRELLPRAEASRRRSSPAPALIPAAEVPPAAIAMPERPAEAPVPSIVAPPVAVPVPVVDAGTDRPLDVFPVEPPDEVPLTADVPAAVEAALTEAPVPLPHAEPDGAVAMVSDGVSAPAAEPAPSVPAAPDDYFSRLGSAAEAFGVSQRAPAGARPAPDAFEDPWTYGDVPTVSGLLEPGTPRWPGASRLGGAADRQLSGRDAFAPDRFDGPEAEEASGAAAVDRENPPATAARSFIADAFHALLEAEQGRPRSMDVRPAAAPPVSPPARPAGPEISDDLIERVTQRVIERLVPHAAREMVAAIVTEVAERIVREEMARVRAQGEGRS